MRQITLNKKTGFKVNDIYQPVVIRDHRGILFYTTEPLLPKVKEFNLPPGTYCVDNGYFSPMILPVSYGNIKLPFPERALPKPDNFKVEFGNNPNKCTIFWKEGRILFDSSFKEKPLYEVFFILFHEEGHSRYKTEDKADLYAAKKMLDYGFNPYQVGIAPLFSLSDRQMFRKNNIVDKLEKYVF